MFSQWTQSLKTIVIIILSMIKLYHHHHNHVLTLQWHWIEPSTYLVASSWSNLFCHICHFMGGGKQPPDSDMPAILITWHCSLLEQSLMALLTFEIKTGIWVLAKNKYQRNCHKLTLPLLAPNMQLPRDDDMSLWCDSGMGANGVPGWPRRTTPWNGMTQAPQNADLTPSASTPQATPSSHI